MEKLFRIKTLVSAVVVVTGVALTGCGSSSGGGGSVASPNGIYTGTITGGSTSFNGIEEKAIIYNNRKLVLSNKADGVSQLFDANLTDPANSLTGTGFRYDPAGPKLNSVNFSGSYVSDVSASVDFVEDTTGAVTLPPGTINLTEDTALSSKGSDLSRLNGTWVGTFVAGSQMTLIIDAAGNIGASSGDSGGGADCGFTGAFSILDAAVNVYALSLISDGGGAGCFVAAATYSGLAWTEGDSNGTLVLIAADGNNGRAVILTKS